jgi:hypothetical protein
MSGDHMTDAEVLEEIDRLAELFRRGSQEGNRRPYFALKAVAIDIRARQDDAIGRAQELLQASIDNAQRGKVNGQFGTGNLTALAELFIGRWPTVRQALSYYAETPPEDR